MNRKKLRINSYAKINLSLNINGKNEVGYHILDTVTASVSLSDTVTVAARLDDKINVYYNGAKIPKGTDSALKAVNALRADFGNFGADIVIDKRLPIAGGLGGSSADAAAVIVGLDKLFDLSARGLNAQRTALKVGSDVPYMLSGGFARVLGAGEDVNYIKGFLPLEAVILYEKSGVDTAKCYSVFDEIYDDFKCSPSDNLMLVKAVESGDVKAALGLFGNALYKPAALINGRVADAFAALENSGAKRVVMSGSGSCCVGFYKDKDEADSAARKLKDGAFIVYRVYTMPKGIVID